MVIINRWMNCVGKRHHDTSLARISGSYHGDSSVNKMVAIILHDMCMKYWLSIVVFVTPGWAQNICTVLISDIDWVRLNVYRTLDRTPMLWTWDRHVMTEVCEHFRQQSVISLLKKRAHCWGQSPVLCKKQKWSFVCTSKYRHLYTWPTFDIHHLTSTVIRIYYHGWEVWICTP